MNIIEIISSGSKYKVWSSGEHIDQEYTIVKVTEERITLKAGTDRAITRKPRQYRDRTSPSGYS